LLWSIKNNNVDKILLRDRDLLKKEQFGYLEVVYVHRIEYSGYSTK
jgi:hypothetical protein